MSHYSEEELIAYQLHESSEEREIRAHLENCLPCAAVSDAVAETLRIYSAERVPEPDFERNWERLRGNLTVLEPEPQGLRRFARWWVWPARWHCRCWPVRRRRGLMCGASPSSSRQLS